MVHVSKKAVQMLSEAGIKATLIDAYSMPLKADGIIKIAQSAGGKILVVEDNYLGGIADEIALAAAGTGGVRVKAMYVQAIPKSAKTPEEILKQVKLTAEDIVAAAKAY
jgi:transketolase C-terminal domain/subunit